MKNVLIIITVFTFLSVFVVSCGQKKNDNSSHKTNTIENSTSKKYSDKYLSVDLSNDWSVSEYGAHNKTYSIFSFKVDSRGNIYDDFNKDHQQIGEISKTTVDGMPAITRLQKYMQNKMKKCRVWLIYDGKNVISFNVAADENVFNDAEANSIMAKVKILNKGKNVKLPTKQNKEEYSKPDSYPADVIAKLKDVLSEDSILTEESLNNAMNAIIKMQQIDKADSNDSVINSIVTKYGFSSLDELLNKTLKPATTCAFIMNMIKNSADQQLDNISFIKDFILQNKVSAADLKFTYEHWDLVMKLYSISIKQ